MLQRVLSKMPKGTAKKATLKTATPKKVELSKLTDVMEMLSTGQGNLEYALEQFFKGREQIILARDIFRFEMNDFLTGRDEFEAIVDQINDLGVDWPEEIMQGQDLIEDTYKLWNELHQEFENLGVSPMRDRI